MTAMSPSVLMPEPSTNEKGGSSRPGEEVWGLILAQPLLVNKALSKLLYSSEPQFPHWVEVGNSNTLHSARLLLRLNQVRNYRTWC